MWGWQDESETNKDMLLRFLTWYLGDICGQEVDNGEWSSYKWVVRLKLPL